MEFMVPGTVLTVPRSEAANVEQQFRSMFLAGGMVLSQVSRITGLEPYMVQNWVKRGFLSKPQQKHYTLRQLCRIININMLRSVLPMDQICGLLSYINGHLDDESDDLIDDSVLYFMFIRLAAQAVRCAPAAVPESVIADIMAAYRHPNDEAKRRVEQVLRIMLTAWGSARLLGKAQNMIRALENPPGNAEWG